MSTRCVINFCNPTGLPNKSVTDFARKIEAKIYRHSDGYPNRETGVLADLDRFFEEVIAQTTGPDTPSRSGTCFSDPSYLAAKFVVWQAQQFCYTYQYDPDGNFESSSYWKTHPLGFLSLGVVTENPVGVEYEYFVVCENGEKPKVFWCHAGDPRLFAGYPEKEV